MITFVGIGFLFLASCLCTGLFLTFYLVNKQSHALKALAQLNFVYKPWIPNVKPFLQTIPTTVDSKAKFDWFNFQPLADDYFLNHQQELFNLLIL
ncbi:MAG: hypothetical protein HKL80_11150 [Acidimicrobiales bacterium]|nr:hypothetical protein [Acidimicrobiales bacterium]